MTISPPLKKHKYTCYSSVSCCDLLNNFNDIYANIDKFNLRENQAQLDTPYNPNQPIEGLYCQITDAVAFTDAGTTPFTVRQIFNAAVSSVAVFEVF